MLFRILIGVVDMSESSSQPEVTESLREFFIPIIPLSLSTLVPPEKMSQVSNGLQQAFLNI